jgi:flagellum-specific ATP synthase
MTPLAEARARIDAVEAVALAGVVATLRGLTILADDFPASVGSLASVGSRGGGRLAEVVGFEGPRAILMPLESTQSIRAGDAVRSLASVPTFPVGRSLLGRVVDGLGRPIDGRGPIKAARPTPLRAPRVLAMRRRPISEPLATGVRAVDAMATVGKGQRMGIFAGPGVGKSTLLGMVARNTSADVNVIALIGERGREVREFVEHTLGGEGLGRSVVVVATSDESPLLRVRAAHAACAIAEHFRAEGADALLMLDSITRFAHAQRQIGLSVGEPPATKGYTPSVFAALPELLERAGAVDDEPGGVGGGSVTAFYTILVEGDDMTEPIADAARGILDGHLMLQRSLAHKGHFPAIDVLDSVSRLAASIVPAQVAEARRRLVSLIAAHRESEELIQIGAYAAGSNPLTDEAIRLMPHIEDFLRQGAGERSGFEQTIGRLHALVARPRRPVPA